MSEIEQKIEAITEPIVEKVPDMQVNNEPVPLEKPKKPRTEKQIEAFKKTQQKRQENIALKKAQPKAPTPAPAPTPPTPAPTPAPKQPDDDFSDKSDSESEEEIVVRRKPKKEKVVKKKKQIVIELSDSESDSEVSVVSKETPKAPSKQRSKFESQQHKKYGKSNDADKRNFFCD